MRIFVAIMVFAACFALPAAPASAVTFEAPDRIENSSPPDTTPVKFARARCPQGEVVIGMGGQINGGNGRVAMTGIVPDQALTMVTVGGRALPGQDIEWSVTAVAVCHRPTIPAPLRVSSEPGQYLARIGCPSPMILYSIGYQIQLAGGGFLREATFSDDVREATVRAGGSGVDPGGLVAYGICAPPLTKHVITHAEPAAFDSTSTKEATAGKPEIFEFDHGSWMFGAGAAVKGAAGVLIDALTPTSGLDGAYARAYKATTSAASLMDGDDDWELQVDGDYVGEWY